MASISDLAASGGTQTTTAASEKKIAASYDLFMNMLTTQVQNQDPLKPMDATQFTNQLVQYTMVEQQISSNKNLDKLLVQMKTQSASQFVNYVGKEVTALGDTMPKGSDGITWGYETALSGDALAEVYDSKGALISRQTIALKTGKGSYKWPGTNDGGAAVADGNYTIKITQTTGDGKKVVIPTQIKGVVDMVDFTSGNVNLKIGGVNVPVGNLTSVSSV
ncbi:flagellar hook assembly protein FlgD [Polycladidibacter stylochi]|uniref:flagellar hook assembly protein FlgD n=1 Tax=Polycladidibacter stylochi TaxID=1807766 RepID=UPI0008350CEB|nr:flagellar hook capping FlgD N-terminal domain-containing protein [Pseudovibrio stylochi]